MTKTIDANENRGAITSQNSVSNFRAGRSVQPRTAAGGPLSNRFTIDSTGNSSLKVIRLAGPGPGSYDY